VVTGSGAANNVGAFVSVLNNITGVFPPSPLLTQERDISEDQICYGKCKNKTAPFCRCLQVQKVKLNSVVDVVFRGGKFLT